MTAETTPVLPSRADRLQKLTDYTFDVLVIGGGITGAGAARDAALRGLRVALIEKEDFGSGTSSRSSRLIHGGLRYLEHGHLRLVFEASMERRLLLKLAPHLVRPLAFVWPVYKGARVARWKLNAGMMLYDGLAMFRNVQRASALSKKEVLAREPLLKEDGLTGGSRYFDAATDDARLSLANALGAAEAGAVVLNHAAVRGLRLDDGKARGARVVDLLTGQELEVNAKVVVNATGPWTDEIRRMDEGEHAPTVRGSKGVHIAVPRARIGNKEALTLLSPLDGRVYFVLPSGPHAIIGTTETPTTAGPDDVRADRGDVQYLLDSANAFFPDARLTMDDVVSAWAGIRPLVSSGYHGGTANSASREHHVDVSPTGVVGISGGKLTTFRVMAADVVDAVEKQLGHKHVAPRTGELPLPGGDFASLEDELAQALEAVGGAGLEETARHLVQDHGRRWRDVVALTREKPELALPIVEELPYVMADAVYAVKYELAETLSDLLVRRTKIAFQTRDNGVGAAEELAPLLAPYLGWSEREIDVKIREYAQDAKRLFGIDPVEPAAQVDEPERASA